MDVHGVNPAQAVTITGGQSDSPVNLNRDAPPPYSVINVPVTAQPVIHHTVIIQPPLKDEPVFINCPHCHERVLTKIRHVATKKTHLLAGFICGSTLWCLMCCLAAIPYIIPLFKSVEHYCPSCDTFIGQYSNW